MLQPETRYDLHEQCIRRMDNVEETFQREAVAGGLVAVAYACVSVQMSSSARATSLMQSGLLGHADKGYVSASLVHHIMARRLGHPRYHRQRTSASTPLRRCTCSDTAASTRSFFAHSLWKVQSSQGSEARAEFLRCHDTAVNISRQ